jgi:CTP synthase
VGRATADKFLDLNKSNSETTKTRNEIFELDGKKYFVGVQYHAEFKSTPFCPSPPFVGLIAATNK